MERALTIEYLLDPGRPDDRYRVWCDVKDCGSVGQWHLSRNLAMVGVLQVPVLFQGDGGSYTVHVCDGCVEGNTGLAAWPSEHHLEHPALMADRVREQADRDHARQ